VRGRGSLERPSTLGGVSHVTYNQRRSGYRGGLFAWSVAAHALENEPSTLDARIEGLEKERAALKKQLQIKTLEQENAGLRKMATLRRAGRSYRVLGKLKSARYSEPRNLITEPDDSSKLK
jgi:hypothetical protein